MIKTIISDLGGVFLNRGIWLFWDYLQEKYNIPKEVGKTAFLKFYKEYFSGKRSEEGFWKDFLNEIDLKEDWKALRELLLELFEVNKEVAELYKNLKGQGYKMVLLSDQTKEWWPYLDNKLKISSYFDILIVSAFIGLNKPDSKLYTYTLNQSNSQPQETLFIDDLEQNLVPAHELGMGTILFENTIQLITRLKELGIKV